MKKARMSEKEKEKEEIDSFTQWLSQSFQQQANLRSDNQTSNLRSCGNEDKEADDMYQRATYADKDVATSDRGVGYGRWKDEAYPGRQRVHSVLHIG